jgi:hypothetical protein
VDRKEEMNLELVPPLLNGIHTLCVRFVPSDVFIVVIRTSVAGMVMIPLDVAVVILWFGVGIIIVHEVSYFIFRFFNTPSKLRRLTFTSQSGGTALE